MHRLKTLILLGSFLLSFRAAFAAPVTADTATSAVQGWLHQDRHPLGQHLSTKIKRTETVKDGSGATSYYVVHLDPAGFVVLTADDAAEPVVAFSASGDFNPASGSPLAAMVNFDLPKRVARARAVKTSKARGKWNAFLAGSPNPPPDSEENGSIIVVSQVRVAPFVKTLWDQQADVSLDFACYNYFTPPGAAGASNNDPCGCVATALAQEMYYFQYPLNGVGTPTFIVSNNGVPLTTSLLGGNGAGGPYQWSNMPLSPNLPTTAQAVAIGALTHDAGAAVNMSYTPSNSFATTVSAQKALTSTFQFASAAYYEQDSTGLSGTPLLNMINPNLDARIPVILGVQPAGGHCLLCDGYGYSSSTIFHHLNTGWGGDNDIWYALPDVETPDNGAFTLVNACIYNIFPTSVGQIISGYVTDTAGAPIPGATVTATGGGGPFTVTTDANGIYALAPVHADSLYTLTVTKAGDSSATNNYTTGQSFLNQVPSGNIWGADFVLAPALLAIPETGFSSIGPTNGPFSVTSQIYNLTNASSSPISWTISNSNQWLTVTSTNGTLAAGGISVFTVALNSTATTLAAGTYSGLIWITNLQNGVAQSWPFSLSVNAADYPITVTGYNRDVVVESDAVGGNTFNYADAFDPDYPDLLPDGGPACFYATNLVVTNIFKDEMADRGLSASGIFTSLLDHATTFEFGPYSGSNVLYLTHGAMSNSLNLSTPATYKSLSILAASAQGGGNGTLVVHFNDGTATPPITFSAPNYLTMNNPATNAALANFGLLAVGAFNEFYSLDPGNSGEPFPTLYQTTINLQGPGSTGKLVTAVTFTLPTNVVDVTTNTVTGIFALSGTAVPYTGNYTVSVGASPSGGGAVSGGGSFLAGSTTPVTATALGAFVFANWTVGKFVVSTSPDYPVIVNSNETLTANFIGNYTVNVNASPADGGTVSGGGTVQAGRSVQLTANTNGGFAFVGWTGDASGTANPLTLNVETNLSITANFIANGNLSVTVLTNIAAYGTVSPNLNSLILTRGKNYTLTARPVSGILFSNWTGSLTTNRNPLIFRAESNMVLEANFVANPFLPIQGTYNGLFSASNGVTETTAGMLKGLKVGSKGTYSGAVLIGGGSHGISGSFSLGGQATNEIKRSSAQGGSLAVEMTIANSGTATPQVIGTVAGTDGVATLLADRASDALSSAEYTVLLPPDGDNSSPGGDGYVLIDNNAGTVKITGALADGTPLSQTTTVSEDGYIPLYANLYAGKGLFAGWINLDSANSDGMDLTWIRPAARSGLYTNGFIDTLSASQILFSQWRDPGTFAALTNISIFDTNITVSIADSGRISGAEVSGTVSPKTGVVTVTIGSGSAKVIAHGALLNATNGGGYFLTKTNAQAVQFGP